MSEIRFYHLQLQTLESALPVMLERTLARGQRALVMASSPERVEALNAHLWTYKYRSFLPHGSAPDGNAAAQPIWLTSDDEHANQASVLFLTDGAETQNLDAFELVCDLFDGGDGGAVQAARDRWLAYKSAGHALTYWQQDAQGKWSQRADA